MLQQADYHLWHTLQSDKISENGNWISYKLAYPNGQDTLFIKNTQTDKQYVFPESTNGNFNAEESFACISPKKGLQILTLKTGEIKIISAVTQYQYTKNKKYIIAYNKGADPILEIKNTSGITLMKINNVQQFKIAPHENAVLFSAGVNTIGFISLNQEVQKTMIIENASAPFYNLVWQNNGNAVAFLQRGVDSGQNNLFFYQIKDAKLFKFESEKMENFPADFIINPTVSTKLFISDDGQRVFFGIKKRALNEQITDPTQVQVWNAADQLLYPQQEEIGQWEKVAKLALWQPFENKFKQITNNQLPKVILAGEQKFALTFNPAQYEPQYKQQGDLDLYLNNLSSGESIRILTTHSGSKNHTVISPTGNFVSYFKDQKWWVYDIRKKAHFNCSINLHQPLSDLDFNAAGEVPAYGFVGWTKNDDSFLLYDKFDIWEVSPDGKKANRLTHGREKNIQFRLAKQFYDIVKTANYDGFYTFEIDLGNDLVLAAKSNDESGYFIWNKTSGEKPIVFNAMRNNYLLKSSKGENYAFQQQHSDKAPSLWFKKDIKSKAQLIVQSNKQQEDFYWGKAEEIHYSNAKGIPLTGSLFYPANYDASKKYPMIVKIYELKMQESNQYINPSVYEDTGFNVSNYTSQGYFVLYPDIIYEIGNPGMSATDCVVAATKSIIERGIVQKDKIGLTGHSFGGYETNFILTQTNLFATAVSSAGIADLTSFYLTMGWNTGTPEIWRFENQQWRMGKSLFQDREGYDRNSPIAHVENITTPLLTWTGGDDMQVDWHQSVAFYVALRRLQKKHVMLIYPKEHHVIMAPKTQKDLSIRLGQWFNHYLKGEKPADWMIKGTSGSN